MLRGTTCTRTLILYDGYIPIQRLSLYTGQCGPPGARFSKTPETFRARKAIFSSSESKDEEVYTPETSCMKRTSLHNKNL